MCSYAYYESWQIGLPFLTTQSSYSYDMQIDAERKYFIFINRTSIDMSRSVQLFDKMSKATNENERARFKSEFDEVNRVEYFSMVNWSFAAALFIPILSLWLLSYFIRLACKWVVIGFRQESTTKKEQ